MEEDNMKLGDLFEMQGRLIKNFIKDSEIEYLGLPYSSADPFIEDWRAEISNMVAVDLTKQGRIIFAPISAWHHLARKYKLPGTFEYWLRLDEEFIKVSKKLLIITLPGWRESTGVTEEIKLAHKYYVPVKYIDPEPYIKEMEFECQPT
jgi:hypothetical protein